MRTFRQRKNPKRKTAVQDERQKLRHREGAWWLMSLVTLCSVGVAGFAHAEAVLATAGGVGSVPANLLLGAIALVGLRRARLALRRANE